METIYGVQADTDTLREAHESQRRMQQRLHEQQSSVIELPPAAATKKAGLSMLKPSQPAAGGGAATGLAKPSPIARSTSTSALPPSTLHAATAGGSTSTITGYSTPGGTDTGYSSPYFTGSAATSPFLNAVDHHHHHSTGPAQLRSTTHSPALFSKFYDGEHRLPWLSLPGAVGSPALSASSGGGGGVVEGPPSMFGRRRSDVGLSSSGRSTPSGLDLSSSSQQEASFPQPPQQQPQAHSSSHHHHHPQHLLGPQELAAMSRHNSPMPLNEALPHYLRKKSVESLHSMERSISSPGANSFHPSSHHAGSPFMLPLGSGSSSSNNSSGGISSHSGVAGGSVGQTAATSPSHLLFAFPGSATSHPTSTTTIPSTGRLEMERASSTGVLPMMNRPSPRPLPQQQHAQTIGNSGPGSTSTGQGPASFFRNLNPGAHHHHHHHHGASSVGLGSISGLDAVTSAASPHSGISTPTKFGTGGTSAIFGHHANGSDRDLPSNKEVHA